MNEYNINDVPESVINAVNELLDEADVRNFSLLFKNLSFVGENSYGLVLRLKVASPNKNPIYYIVKMSPKNEARRKQMKVVDFYNREVFIYTNVITEYIKLQETFNIPQDKAFNATPKMYYASLKDKDEFIIFDDLEQLGYYRFDRKKSLTFELTSLALKELAKFHAMSFVLKEKNRKTFNEFTNDIKDDNLFSPNIPSITIEFARKYIKRTMGFLAKETVENKNVLLDYLSYVYKNFKDICVKIVNGRLIEPYAVICHGDFWNNNILYKYDENGSPISAKILDFQISRYAPPVLDVVHYLFSCTEKKLRDDHFHEFIKIYYSSLIEHMKLFDLNAEALYPYSIFEDQLKKYGVYGFCMATLSVPFFIADSCELPDIDAVSEAIRDLLTNKEPNGSASGSSESDKANQEPNGNASTSSDNNKANQELNGNASTSSESDKANQEPNVNACTILESDKANQEPNVNACTILESDKANQVSYGDASTSSKRDKANQELNGNASTSSESDKANQEPNVNACTILESGKANQELNGNASTSSESDKANQEPYGDASTSSKIKKANQEANGNASNSSESDEDNQDQNGNPSYNLESEKATAIVNTYELLNERTAPIFKKRMIGVVVDLDKYDMLNTKLL